MDGFQRRKEKKKESIMKAAFELFISYGFQKVSVAEIAKKANVSQVTIYNYFGDKDSLFKSVFYNYMDEKIGEAEALVDSDIPFPEKLRRLLLEKTEEAARTEKAFISADFQDPALLELIEHFGKTRSFPMFIKLLEEGKKEGYIDKNISAGAVIMYFNTFKALLDNPEFFKEENRHLREEVAQLYFYGFMGKPYNDEKG